MRSNPHADWIGACSRSPVIDSGRIDYGTVGGRPQVYEINTNPTIVSAETLTRSLADEWFSGVFAEHFALLESSAPHARARGSIRLEGPLKGLGARVAGAVLQRLIGRQLRRPI